MSSEQGAASGRGRGSGADGVFLVGLQHGVLGAQEAGVDQAASHHVEGHGRGRHQRQLRLLATQERRDLRPNRVHALRARGFRAPAEIVLEWISREERQLLIHGVDDGPG